MARGMPESRLEQLLTARSGAGHGNYSIAAPPSTSTTRGATSRRASFRMSLEELKCSAGASGFNAGMELDTILRRSSMLQTTKHGFVRLAPLESEMNTRRNMSRARNKPSRNGRRSTGGIAGDFKNCAVCLPQSHLMNS